MKHGDSHDLIVRLSGRTMRGGWGLGVPLRDAIPREILEVVILVSTKKSKE